MTTNPEFENKIVLAAINALIGSITPYVAAVSVDVDQDAETAKFYFALTARDGILESLLDDLPTDISVLTDDAVYVSIDYWIGEKWYEGWPGADKRMIYGAYQR